MSPEPSWPCGPGIAWTSSCTRERERLLPCDYARIGDPVGNVSAGRWIIYVSYPGDHLRRNRIDGTERIELTRSYAQILLPRW